MKLPAHSCFNMCHEPNEPPKRIPFKTAGKSQTLSPSVHPDIARSSEKDGTPANACDQTQVEETRQRLRLKLLERQLSRGPGASPGELRRQLLVEAAQ